MQPSGRAQSHGIENLNSSCFCISVDVDELKRQFEMTSELRGLPLQNMFASMPVFVSRSHLDHMAAIIRAAEAGDEVGKGEVLAVLQPTAPAFQDIRTRKELKAMLEAANAAVTQAEHEVHRLQLPWISPKPS